jgi:hypothetical protein
MDAEEKKKNAREKRAALKRLRWDLERRSHEDLVNIGYDCLKSLWYCWAEKDDGYFRAYKTLERY